MKLPQNREEGYDLFSVRKQRVQRCIRRTLPSTVTFTR
jgi:hypothetical protein